MKITNNEGLPEPIVKALQNDDYDKGKADYSATQLLDPPRKVMLTRRHWDEIEQDAADMLALLKGKMIHKLLEQAKVGDQIQEERLYLDVCGRVLSGQADLFDGHTISDYKNTSAWTAVYKDRWDEWEAQLNIYASLFEAAGFKVGAVQIVALYGDWSATEALRSPDYPQ